MKTSNLLLTLAALAFIVMGPLYNSSSLSSFNGPGIGEDAPDLSFKGPDGKKEYTLSDLEGNVVLLDFWASWCAPCRKENPNLVRVYEKYKDADFKEAKGFTLYSVSLDRRRERWKKAIDKDGLDWKYHVSDLKGWNSAAAEKYSVSQIPSNFLIDEEGKIIATNLKGIDLDQKLDELVEEL